jgi:hypothetical protein
MGYVVDFWRAVEGTRLRCYTPSLSSSVELIPPPIQCVGGQLMADKPESIGMMHCLEDPVKYHEV